MGFSTMLRRMRVCGMTREVHCFVGRNLLLGLQTHYSKRLAEQTK